MTAGYRLGLVLLLLCRCSLESQAFLSDGGVALDLGPPDLAGCDTFACLGVLAYGDKSAANVASSCVGYKANLRPSPVCEGCVCVTDKSDCTITASTWADATCSTTLVDRKSVGLQGNAGMSTYASFDGYAKVDSATTKCSLDTTAKGGPVYTANEQFICNYFGPCSDLSCAAASEAQCLLLDGNAECPDAFSAKEVAFASVDDKRTCACDCVSAVGSCASVPGAQVASLHTINGPIPLTLECKAHKNTGSAPPNNVSLNGQGTLKPSCVPAGKPVTGTIEVRGYKTVCCR